MDYKERLKAFNNTDKYKKELEFLQIMLGDSLNLDYGCGLGGAKKLAYHSFDVNDYFEGDKDWFNYHLNELPDEKFDNIFMMHSIAHISNPIEVLKDLKQRYNATITVITPNRLWLDEGYQSDETVIKHYDQVELHDLFTAAGYEVSLIGQFGELKKGFNERIFLQAK